MERRGFLGAVAGAAALPALASASTPESTEGPPTPLVEALKVYRFEPGDRLILRVDDLCPWEDMKRMGDQAAVWAGLPRDRIVVFASSVDLEVVRGLPG